VGLMTPLALAIALLAVAPLAAHLLRRRRAGTIDLPTARLLASSPPNARRRSALEDRSLFALRVLAVVALALLASTPFVRCGGLRLARPDGASMAVVFVIDDSLSMRVGAPRSRLEQAKSAALDLLEDAAPGDSFAVVLAGNAPRVVLAPSGDFAAVRAAIEAVAPSDRATDLEGALALASELVRAVPQRDRRVALLSDRADGRPDGPAFATTGDVKLWEPVPALAAAGEPDCALIRAVRARTKITVKLHCTVGASAAGRAVGIFQAEASPPTKALVEVAANGSDEELTLELPEETAGPLRARLLGDDAIEADDSAPVIEAGGVGIALLVDRASPGLVTGGPPPIEQALAALGLGAALRPLTALPEQPEDLAAIRVLVLDDPPGLTPEERRSLGAWTNAGGHLVLALGERARNAPLGSGFGELVPGVLRSVEPSGAVDVARCGALGESASSLDALAPTSLVALEPVALEGTEVLCAFASGEPLFAKRSTGRGAVWLVTTSLDVASSDLPLRPAFLAWLDQLATAAGVRSGAPTVEAGEAFVIADATDVSARAMDDADERPPIERVGRVVRIPTARTGRYEVTVDGAKEVRFVELATREISFTPRPVRLPESRGDDADAAERTELSPWLAGILLLLLVAELVVRAVFARTAGTNEPPVEADASAPRAP
jgi:hypothetical protein